MKIALCISGQPRTWEACYNRWIELFSPFGEIDFFFHFWDYNTLPRLLDSSCNYKIEDEPIGEEEKLKIVNTLKPKGYLFESRKPISYWNTSLPVEKQFGPWCAEQFYSLYRVSLLKREFEIYNNFQYDLVVRLRSDLWIEDEIKIESIDPGILYTAHCSWDSNFRCYRVGDIFYYSDSYTFDQMAGFFKFLSFVPTDWVIDPNAGVPPPEIALYFYMANIGILNHPTHCSMKIMRDPRVLEIKGSLDRYEIIK